MRSVFIIALEALVIGVILMNVFKIVSLIFPRDFAVFISGAVFHIVFEIVGLNGSWCAFSFPPPSITQLLQ